MLFASRQLGKCTEQFTAVVQQFAETERRYGDAGILDGKCAPIGVFRAWANKQLADVVIKFANVILFGKLDEYPSLQRDVERIKEAILKFGDGVSLWVAEQIQFNMEQIIQHSTWRYFPNHEELFPDQYLINLAAVRDEEIVELWPSQIYAIRNMQLLGDFKQIAIALKPQSGRTLLAEFAIAHALSTYAQKCVYVVHSVYEAFDMQRRLEQSFAELARNIFKVSVLTGSYDISPADRRRIHNSAVLVMSLEKFDTMIRQESELLSLIDLIVLDNVHLVQEYYRGIGVTYEFLLMRLKANWPDKKIVWIANSPSNLPELSSWLSTEPVKVIAERPDHDSSKWLPAQTRRAIYDKRGKTLRYDEGPEIGFPHPRSRSQAMLPPQEASVKLALVYAKLLGKAVIVSTWSSYTESIAQKLADELAIESLSLVTSQEQQVVLDTIANQVHEEFGLEDEGELILSLTSYLRSGFAFYNGRVPGKVRQEITRLFDAGHLRIVVGTQMFVEDTRVPCQAIVLPYWKYPSAEVGQGTFIPQYVSSALFLSISSKSRQPAHTPEGHIVVIKHSRPGEEQAVEEEIQSRYLAPTSKHLKIVSSLLDVTVPRIMSNMVQWEDVLRFQSQLVAFIKDGFYYDNQSRRIADLSLSAYTEVSPTALAEAIERLFQRFSSGRMETRALAAGSPYEITEFGSVVSITGLAYDSCVNLFNYIEQGLSNEPTRLEYVRADGDLLESPFAFCMGAAFVTEEAESAYLRNTAWQRVPDLPQSRISMLLDWLLREQSILELAQRYWAVEVKRGAKKELVQVRSLLDKPEEDRSPEETAAIEEALLQVSEYTQRMFQSIGADSLRAFSLVLDYYTRETKAGRGLITAGEIALFGSYLKYRTTDPIVCYLLDTGIRDREVALALAAYFRERFVVSYDPEHDWEAFVKWLFALEQDELAERIEQDKVEDTWRQISRYRRLHHSGG
ncbi:MAG: hypothetical protein HWN51_03110 [Desulfobacterales bacterium]|nr:hypothetical protein [Desulfobacterales bacterium]